MAQYKFVTANQDRVIYKYKNLKHKILNVTKIYRTAFYSMFLVVLKLK
jgi:hypothetical protein